MKLWHAVPPHPARGPAVHVPASTARRCGSSTSGSRTSSTAKIGLNYEYLNGGPIPWYVPRPSRSTRSRRGTAHVARLRRPRTMLSYLLRRLLLFIPTLIGATARVLRLMALSPVGIVDVAAAAGRRPAPGQRAVREAYLHERYGLDKPPIVQYLRWLNKVSPVGFRTWKRDDPEVVAATSSRAALRRRRSRRARRRRGTGKQIRTSCEGRSSRPDAGDIRFNKPASSRPTSATASSGAAGLADHRRGAAGHAAAPGRSRCRSRSRSRCSPASGRPGTAARSQDVVTGTVLLGAVGRSRSSGSAC